MGDNNSALLTDARFMQSSQRLKADASLTRASKAYERQQSLTKKLSHALHGRALFVFEAVLYTVEGLQDGEQTARLVKAVEMHAHSIRMDGLLWGPVRHLSVASDKVHIP